MKHDPAEHETLSAPIDPERFSGIRAIYFDLDDTLCGYWDASKAGLREAFELHGPEGYSPEEMLRVWARAFRSFSPKLKETRWYKEYLKSGEPSRTEQMRLALAQLGIDDAERAHRLSEAYARERDAALRLFPDALDLLNALKPKYKLGLITNGPADIQRQEIETLGIGSFFSNVMIEGELGFGKPVPEVFAIAGRAFGCQPAELLFVGNSYHHDIRPSIEAGWRTIWIRRPSDVPPSIDGKNAKPESIGPDEPRPTAIVGDLASLMFLA